MPYVLEKAVISGVSRRFHEVVCLKYAIYFSCNKITV